MDVKRLLNVRQEEVVGELLFHVLQPHFQDAIADVEISLSFNDRRFLRAEFRERDDLEAEIKDNVKGPLSKQLIPVTYVVILS